MAIQLSEGALEVILTGGDFVDPVMQILSSKKIQGSGSNERYRLLISDGKHTHSFVVLKTQLNPMLTSGELSDFTIVKVDRYTTSVLNSSGDMRVMEILALTVLASGISIGMKIGNPSKWQERGSASSGPPSAPLAQTRPTPAPSAQPSHTTAPHAQPSHTPAPSAQPMPISAFFAQSRPTPAPPAQPSHTTAPPAQPSHTPASSAHPSHTPTPSAQPRPISAFFAQPRPTPAPPVPDNTNGHVAGQFAGRTIHPIISLRPYQNKIIKVRVMSKSGIRTWNDPKGEGKMFSMDLFDETGEIRATAFKEQCDKYYDMIEVDKVYYISRYQLNIPKKQYSSLKNNYEMNIMNYTVVEECTEDLKSVPGVNFHFIPICDIASKEPDSIVDVIGVCKDTTDVVEFVAKTGRQLKKREITLIDQSGSAISLIMWGEEAVKFDGSQKPVVAVKAGSIGEFGGGKTLNMRMGTALRINPDIPEAHELRGWFHNEGATMESTNMSAR